MDATRSVLLASNYEAWPEAFNGQAYALLNVVRSLEHAQLLCPPAADYTRGRGVNPGVSYLLNELKYRSVSALQRLSGQPALSNAQPRVVEQDYDLFFYVCQFPRELSTLGASRDGASAAVPAWCTYWKPGRNCWNRRRPS